jgi:hypothetical protein
MGMKRYTRAFSRAALLLLLLWCGTAANAASLEISVELPRLAVAEYHKPYVALWLENDQNQATQVAVWYDMAMRENKGLEWLKDLRQWWRRGGRALEMPIDGVSGATRGPGVHQVTVDNAKLAALAAGQYRLRVEASREVGGRELVEIPLTLPLATSQTLEATGSSELGRISVQVNP